MAAIRKSVRLGYRRLGFRQAQIAISGRIMVSSYLAPFARLEMLTAERP